MNLEEAVEHLKFEIDNKMTRRTIFTNQAIEVVLKEIEYLKKNQRYKKDFNGDKIFCLEYDKETLRDMVLEQQEEIEELRNKVFKREKEIIELEEYANKNFIRKDDVKAKYIVKDKIKEIIKEELPDDEICEACEIYDVNGVVIKQKLIKLLEEDE